MLPLSTRGALLLDHDQGLATYSECTVSTPQLPRTVLPPLFLSSGLMEVQSIGLAAGIRRQDPPSRGKSGVYSECLASQVGVEPTTSGFVDRCSSN